MPCICIIGHHTARPYVSIVFVTNVRNWGLRVCRETVQTCQVHRVQVLVFIEDAKETALERLRLQKKLAYVLLKRAHLPRQSMTSEKISTGGGGDGIHHSKNAKSEWDEIAMRYAGCRIRKGPGWVLLPVRAARRPRLREIRRQFVGGLVTLC